MLSFGHLVCKDSETTFAFPISTAWGGGGPITAGWQNTKKICVLWTSAFFFFYLNNRINLIVMCLLFKLTTIHMLLLTTPKDCQCNYVEMIMFKWTNSIYIQNYLTFNKQKQFHNTVPLIACALMHTINKTKTTFDNSLFLFAFPVAHVVTSLLMTYTES